MSSKFIASFCSAFAALGFCQVARADIGLSPVAPQGTYVSFEGGYLFQDGPDVIGHGIKATSFTNVLVSPDDGWFAGGMIGFASAQRYLPPLPFSRTEIYFSYGEADDSTTRITPPPSPFSTLYTAALKSVDGTALAFGGDHVRTSISRTTWEGGLRFEGDDITSPASSLTWVLSPFIRFSDEDTVSSVGGCCTVQRSADVDSRLYGALLALEPEVNITPGVSLVGRVGAGIYGYRVHGKFHSMSSNPAPDPFLADISASDTGVGFRGQLGAGLKFKLTEGARLETFVEADYFSDIGTARTADNDPVVDATSSVSTDDQWELKAGARLPVGLSGGN